MKNAGILILTLGFFLSAAISGAAGAAETVTKKQFRQDLSYYRKTAQEKSLNANDRLFILNRLREKYSAAKFDITELYGEIDKWSARRIKEWKEGETVRPPNETAEAPPAPTEIPQASAQPAAEPALAAEKPAATQAARLNKLLITQSAGKSVLTLNVPGLEEFKEVPVEEAAGENPSAAIIYLYNARNVLPARIHNVKPAKGYIREVQVKRVTAKPPTVKISVAFRKNYPYDIERSGDRLILNVYDTAPQRAAPAPTPLDTVEAAPEAIPQTEAAAAEAAVPSKLEPLSPEPFLEHASSQTIESGQIVSVNFVKYPDFSRTTVVSPDGRTHLPPAGMTAAAGLTAEQLSGSAAKKIEDSFLKSAVQVSAKDFDPEKRVALIGCVKNEGVYGFAAGMGCYELVSRSGGFAAGADKRSVLIHRMTKKSRKKLSFDIAAFAESSEPVDDFHLEPGDVVEVRKILPAYVFGEVRAEGFYRVKESTGLAQMLTTAGGLKSRANLSKIFLIREEEGQNMKRTFSLNEIKNGLVPDPAVREGDLIHVPALTGKSKAFNKETISWGAFFISLGLVLALLV